MLVHDQPAVEVSDEDGVGGRTHQVDGGHREFEDPVLRSPGDGGVELGVQVEPRVPVEGVITGGVNRSTDRHEAKAAFATEPTGPNQVWQLDFPEFETAAGGSVTSRCRSYSASCAPRPARRRMRCGGADLLDD